MNLMKEKLYFICLLIFLGRGEIVLEEIFEVERLYGFKVGKDFFLYIFYYMIFY